jgi:hypothetical protein
MHQPRSVTATPGVHLEQRRRAGIGRPAAGEGYDGQSDRERSTWVMEGKG